MQPVPYLFFVDIQIGPSARAIYAEKGDHPLSVSYILDFSFTEYIDPSEPELQSNMLSNGLLAAYGISLFGVSYPLFGNLGEHFIQHHIAWQTPVHG